jgi:hypothetical protein
MEITQNRHCAVSPHRRQTSVSELNTGITAQSGIF